MNTEKLTQLNAVKQSQPHSELLAMIDAISETIKKREISLFKQRISQLEKLLGNLYDKTEGTLLVSLNVTSKNQGFLFNYLLKVITLTYLFTVKLKFSKTAIQNHINVALILVYNAAPSLLRAQQQVELIPRLRLTLTNIANTAFNSAKEMWKDNPETLRLLTQLANINEFKNKNQLSQSIVIVCINSALKALSLNGKRVQTIKKATFNSLLGSNVICHKPFVKCYAHQLSSILDQSKLSALGLLANNKVALIESVDSESAVVTAFVFENKEWIDLDTGQVRFLLPQHKTDLAKLGGLLSQLNVEQENSALQFHNIVRYAPPQTLQQTSKVFLSKTTALIAEHLNKDIARAKMVIQYANSNTRADAHINDIKHAISLLGLLRVYPVICLSEMQLLERKNIGLGEFDTINKENVFGQISNYASKAFSLDIPEYIEMMARILFQGLLSIPKVRYAISNKDRIKELPSSLCNAYANVQLNNWRRTTLSIAKQWQLPKLYQATLVSFFEIKNNEIQLSSLPTKTRDTLDALLITEWTYLNWLQGNNKVTEFTPIIPLLKKRGLMPRDFSHFYFDAISQVNPYSTLS